MSSTRVIAVDVGNTTAHVGIVDVSRRACIRTMLLPTKDILGRLTPALQSLVDAEALSLALPIVVCTVVPLDRDLLSRSLAAAGFPAPVWFTDGPTLPILVEYDIPHTLGLDRLADCLYGYSAFPGASQIIIDAGTAITVDFLKDGAQFLGGAILPGLSTQLSGLHDHTAALPPMSLDEDPIEFPGQSTRAAMIAGVTYGTAGALSFIVERYAQKFGKDSLVLATGGAWKYVENLVSFEFRFVPEMTIIGTGLYGTCGTG